MKKIFLSLVLFTLTLTGFTQNWQHVKKLTASDRDANDYFGYSVSISGDYAIIGAKEDEGTWKNYPYTGCGSAYIYKKDESGNWNELQKIVASDNRPYDQFGYSVAIDGEYAIVGAPNDNGFIDREGAYVFKLNENGVWVETQKLLPINWSVDIGWASSVDISGKTMTITGGGYVYVFELNSANTWVQKDKIRPESLAYSSRVALYDSTMVIGSFSMDAITLENDTITNAGVVYIFEKNQNGKWVEIQHIYASNASQGDLFGSAIDVYENTIVVGAYSEGDDDNFLKDAGSAYIFQKQENNVWVETQLLTDEVLRFRSNHFGSSVAVDENQLIIGSEWGNFNSEGKSSLNQAGAAFIYKNEGGAWILENKIVAVDRSSSDNFGLSVAIDNGTVICGAPSEDEDENGNVTFNGAGAAYIFENSTILSTIDQHKAEVYLYPNPVSEQLFVGANLDNGEIEISTFEGVVIKRESFTKGSPITMDIPDGFYFVKIIESNKVIKNTKIIKK